MNINPTQLRRAFQPYARTVQLAASYLAIIMIMSISFSTVIYQISAHEIGRQRPPASFYGEYNALEQDIFSDFFEDRIARGRHEIFVKLFMLNIAVLTLGSFISYVLARRTLAPIEEAMEAQSRFASDASHELRTPLAAIQAENEVALRNGKLSLARSKELLASNLEEARRLQALSENLLQLASQDTDNIELSPLLLPEVVREAMNSHSKAAKAKSIRMDEKVSNTIVLGNEAALTQAIGILLDNAIKYSPPKTTIIVTGGTKNKQGYVSVADEGPGIAKADLPHIFERFYRADPSRTSQHVSGHGLGLALAKQLIEQRGGSIGVNSKSGKGARFTIQLPLA